MRRYTRLTSTSVAFQTHVAQDSSYVLLPIMEQSTIRGWRIYHTTTGQFLTDQTFGSVPEATSWIEQHAQSEAREGAA